MITLHFHSGIDWLLKQWPISFQLHIWYICIFNSKVYKHTNTGTNTVEIVFYNTWYS